ncbi:MAG: hypothetical protein ACRDNF_02960, partial [Streptosporangiaceae bacterium]
MALNALTNDYLAEIAHRGMAANGLVELARQRVDLAATTYTVRCLTRPVFLEAAEVSSVGHDVERLQAALASLPERMFGGDVAAFAEAVGGTPVQARAVARAAVGAPSKLCRADFFADEGGFRVLEVNMGSTVGGLDNGLLNEALLTHPLIADFVAAHGLTYVDTLGVLVDTLREECGVGPEDKPYVVAVDAPGSYETLAPQLRYSADLLGRYGLEVDVCHLGQLSFHTGRVWLKDRAIDVIYRVFMIEDLLDPEVAGLIAPVLTAVERGEVRMFVPLDAEIYGSKGALALLSDEANRHLFSADELASLDRILPWTRMVRPGAVTTPDGDRHELAGYALANQAELLIKPVLMHAGQGVLPGWNAGPQQWREQLAAAMDGPYVLQRRVHPLSEPFPADGGLRSWVLSLSVFHGAGGFSGLWIRA